MIERIEQVLEMIKRCNFFGLGAYKTINKTNLINQQYLKKLYYNISQEKETN